MISEQKKRKQLLFFFSSLPKSFKQRVHYLFLRQKVIIVELVMGDIVVLDQSMLSQHFPIRMRKIKKWPKNILNPLDCPLGQEDMCTKYDLDRLKSEGGAKSLLLERENTGNVFQIKQMRHKWCASSAHLVFVSKLKFHRSSSCVYKRVVPAEHSPQFTVQSVQSNLFKQQLV